MPGTLDHEDTPTPPNSGEKVEQCNQGSFSRLDDIYEIPKRVIKKLDRLIEEMEGMNCVVDKLASYELSVADDVDSCESATYKQAISCRELVQWLTAIFYHTEQE